MTQRQIFQRKRRSQGLSLAKTQEQLIRMCIRSVSYTHLDVYKRQHHESARGQHEIDFKYSGALESADNIMTFKTVVKTIAQRNGLHATFMPKPLNGQPGSGMHINMSLMKDNENVFTSDFGGLTDEARWFAAGVLAHIRGISAVSVSYTHLCKDGQHWRYPN